MGSLSLLQGNFLTQESNQGLLHCRRILYQLSYPGSPDPEPPDSKTQSLSVTPQAADQNRVQRNPQGETNVRHSQNNHILSFRLPCGLAGKESACYAGDLGSIPRLGRSPGEGKGYPPIFVGFPCGSAGKESACDGGDLGWIPGLRRSPGKGNGHPPSILAWRIPWTGIFRSS